MPMPMVMTVAQQQRADDIHHQPDDSDQGRRTKLHVGRLEQAQDRLDTNAQGHQRQDQCRGKAAQVTHLAGAEAVARAVRMALGVGVGRRRDAQRTCMGGHMKTVGQQRHGAGQGAGGNLRHHHHHGQHHHPQGAFGVFFMGSPQEHMAVCMAVHKAHLE